MSRVAQRMVVTTASALALIGVPITAVSILSADTTASRGVKVMEAIRPQGEPSGKGPLGTHSHNPNRLVHEKSPYLLQHAYNPVDWYAWGDEAFEKARKEDKPIFLSIGYSTCHWCHVMERESFEDAEVARAMNDAFVSIKVDREERPDIDHIYMTVCQMMVGSGGWPLNIIMSPDKKPFFAGTYFPKETRSGRIGMLDLAARVKELWSAKRDEVMQSAEKVMTALKQIPDDSPGDKLGKDVPEAAYQQLAQRFDEKYGGFGNAPKFPTPHNMLFLLRYGKRTGEPRALEMVEKTLKAMRDGGMYDHVGYGFHRYSTDEQWLVPHFEKMLYDQALLAMLYVEAYQATGKTEYATTASEIFTYVLRDMTSSEGGFYSAEDADSEGEEGKFYVWKLEEIQRVLGPQDAELLTRVFHVWPAGNFHEEATGKLTGNNILHRKESIETVAARLGTSREALEERIRAACEKLLAVRQQRIHPYKDDKILTDWNGLMIAALSKGAQALGRPEYAVAAQKAADFVLSRMREQDGRLLHRFREGEVGLAAHVDDYAFFIWGLLELYEATFEVRFLRTALDLNREFLSRFWDAGRGRVLFHLGRRHGSDLAEEGSLRRRHAVGQFRSRAESAQTRSHDGKSRIGAKSGESGASFRRQCTAVSFRVHPHASDRRVRARSRS